MVTASPGPGSHRGKCLKCCVSVHVALDGKGEHSGQTSRSFLRVSSPRTSLWGCSEASQMSLRGPRQIASMCLWSPPQLATRPLDPLSAKPVRHQRLGGGPSTSICDLFCFLRSFHFLQPSCHFWYVFVNSRLSIRVPAVKTVSLC